MVRGALGPVAWLEVVLWLVERVLWMAVRDSSSSSYSLDHLSGFSELNCFGFILVVICWERGVDDYVEDTWG